MINYYIESDITKAQAIWNSLSPKTLITDTWEFRFAYYKYFMYPLFFYVAVENDNPVGLLPLQLNTEKNCLEFFGGSYMEDNSIYVKPKYNAIEIRKELLSKIDKPAHLEWIGDDLSSLSEATIEDYKYTFPIKNVSDTTDYLNKFWNSKRRNNIRTQIQKLKEQKLQITYNEKDDFSLMATFNKHRFGEESTFLFPHREDFFKDLLSLFDVQFITISLNNEKVSVGMSIFYNGTYIGLNSGTKEGINGLGKLMILEKMKQALSLKATLYDARAGDLGWKESFHFERKPQYELDLKTKQLL